MMMKISFFPHHHHSLALFFSYQSFSSSQDSLQVVFPICFIRMEVNYYSSLIYASEDEALLFNLRKHTFKLEVYSRTSVVHRSTQLNNGLQPYHSTNVH
jgi:hypothetical protein